ncbi:hypothetical protein I317_02746 [Kwoniella heveanensis CBS 569]|nr:hypothetical protein I317_02746 [Kwoniella heveanensis CBS 569]
MDAIINRPNRIREKQIAYQAEGGKAPVYLRGNGKIWFLSLISQISSTIYPHQHSINILSMAPDYITS